MPTINNYTFSPISFQIEEQDDIANSIGQNFATITIYPNEGFTVSASDFSASGYNESYIDSVDFVQSGNNVVCNVFFVAGITMPSANVNLPLCIIGQGVVNEITIAGTFTANVGSNVTGDGSETNTPYLNSGGFGETELLFSKTYSAAANYYLDVGPGIQVIEGNQSNYNIVQTPTYDSENRLTSITYNVNYVYPSQNISGDKIAVRFISAKEIYVAPSARVTNWCIMYKNGCAKFDPLQISEQGITTNFKVEGDEGAVFSITVTDDNSVTGPNTWTPAVNQTIPASGVLYIPFTFPDVQGFLSLSNVFYTSTISGNLLNTLPTTRNVFQPITAPRISFTGTSANGITGYSTVYQDGRQLQVIEEGERIISLDWTLTVPSGSIIPLDSEATATMVRDIEGVAAEVTAAASNSATLQLDDTSSILAGDKFNISNIYNQENVQDSGRAVFEFEVVSVDTSNQITVTPNISIQSGFNINFWRNEGNVVTTKSIISTQIDDETIRLQMDFNVLGFGDESVVFIVDLDQLIEVIDDIACASTAVSGGAGTTDLSMDLDAAGGLIAFLVQPQSVADKFEIIHGLPSGSKKATSSMIAANNDGPFDNIFGTYGGNTIPTSQQIEDVDQFIGSSKGTIPTRETEFNLDTNFDIPNMTVGGVTYQQIVWWQYTADDYSKDSKATLRITGPSGTGWKVLRVCCPGANCQAFVPSPFGLTAANSTATNACADTSYVNTIYVSYDQFELGKTVYTDSGLTIGNEFVGDGTSFYGVDDTPEIAIKIDANGVIIDYIHLCITLP